MLGVVLFFLWPFIAIFVMNVWDAYREERLLDFLTLVAIWLASFGFIEALRYGLFRILNG